MPPLMFFAVLGLTATLVRQDLTWGLAMDHGTDRRSFLALSGSALAATGAAAITGHGAVAAEPVQPTMYIRREARSAGGSAMLTSYRNGVAAMMLKPDTDPTSWAYQANMHGTYDARTLAAWKSCQHGNFLFVTWHRMYVYWFERIVRKASGDVNFALPYWNYGLTGQRGLPPEFLDQNNPPGNKLYRAGRAMTDPGDEIPDFDWDPTPALNDAVFLGQTHFGGLVVAAPLHASGGGDGLLELQPHDYVHGDIGGAMGDPNRAANDPIFWLHHANIDRLWSAWIRLGAGRVNPTTNALFMNHQFTFFDENGTQVQMKGSEVLTTATQLGYRYDTEPMSMAELRVMLAAFSRYRQFPRVIPRLFYRPPRWPPPPPPPEFRDKGLLVQQLVTLGTPQVLVSLPVPAAVRTSFMRLLGDPRSQRHVTLVLEGLNVSRPPGGRVDVYLMAGRQSDAAARRAVDANETAVYAGTLNFFAIFGEQGTSEGVRNGVVAVEVNDVLRTQLALPAAADGSLTVVFRARGPVRKDGADRGLAVPFQVSRISLQVQ